jgi:hypothetical protein
LRWSARGFANVPKISGAEKHPKIRSKLLEIDRKIRDLMQMKIIFAKFVKTLASGIFRQVTREGLGDPASVAQRRSW